MIAMPFHPSNVYTIEDVNANLADVLHDVEQPRAGKPGRCCGLLSSGQDRKW